MRGAHARRQRIGRVSSTVDAATEIQRHTRGYIARRAVAPRRLGITRGASRAELLVARASSLVTARAAAAVPPASPPRGGGSTRLTWLYLEGAVVGGVVLRRNYAGVAIGCLPLTHPVRLFAVRVTQHRAFELLVMSAILANCGTMMAQRPGQPITELELRLEIADLAFLAVFTFEAGMKIIALGFAWSRASYLRDRWNCLDLLVVLLSWLSYIAEQQAEELDMGGGSSLARSALAQFRAARVLRSLRALTVIPSLRKDVESLLLSVQHVARGYAVLVVFFLFFFGVLGLYLFGGKLRFRCATIGSDGSFAYIDSDEVLCTAVDQLALLPGRQCPAGSECVDSGVNPNYNITSFDNIAIAMLTLFQCLIGEGWSDVAYATMDATSPFFATYFFVFMLFGFFIVLNLLLAIIDDVYHTLAESYDERLAMVRKQDSLCDEKAMQAEATTVGTGVLELIRRQRKGTLASEEGSKGGEEREGKEGRPEAASESPASAPSARRRRFLSQGQGQLLQPVGSDFPSPPSRRNSIGSSRGNGNRLLRPPSAAPLGCSLPLGRRLTRPGSLPRPGLPPAIGPGAMRGRVFPEGPPRGPPQPSPPPSPPPTLRLSPPEGGGEREEALAEGAPAASGAPAPAPASSSASPPPVDRSSSLFGSLPIVLSPSFSNGLSTAVSVASQLGVRARVTQEEARVLLAQQLEEELAKSIWNEVARMLRLGFVRVDDLTAQVPCCVALSRAASGVVEHRFFAYAAFALILANTVSMSVETPYQSLKRDSELAVLNVAFTVAFSLEMALKLTALGLARYTDDSLNVFDAFVVVLSAIEQVLVASTSTFISLGAIRSLRTFRLLRVFKLARSWTSFRELLVTVRRSVAAVSNFVALLALFIL
ncbi:Ion transport protein-domain-containing protein, partial [Pavlovales sp. CCMP2436]